MKQLWTTIFTNCEKSNALFYEVLNRIGLNLVFEFESAHELLINLNLNSAFAKSMNLNLVSVQKGHSSQVFHS